jgi:nucleotidyltransferase/DNA polymerase involved in DNA repair
MLAILPCLFATPRFHHLLRRLMLPVAAPAGKPLAVCHSASAQGSGEVSAASYEARIFGIRAGMMIADAKARCPALLVVPYEFEKYEEASLQVRRCFFALAV